MLAKLFVLLPSMPALCRLSLSLRGQRPLCVTETPTDILDILVEAGVGRRVTELWTELESRPGVKTRFLLEKLKNKKT